MAPQGRFELERASSPCATGGSTNSEHAPAPRSPDVRAARQEAEVAQRGNEVGQGETAQAGQLGQVQQAGVPHSCVLQHNLLHMRKQKAAFAACRLHAG